MSSAHSETRAKRSATDPGTSTGTRVMAGALGGLAGGIVFGILMSTMGMLSMIASLVGSNSAIVGFLVHLTISVLIGLTLTVPGAGLLRKGLIISAVVGGVYGMLWWVLGPLLIMPTIMGMPIFALDAGSGVSLMGHAVYGLILGLVAALIIRRGR
ncbi:hypothetical protein ACX80Z_08010 [Arthrobacter sp. TMT4-20]|uniref:hypothetical protein n=1 Tax=Arthrobacter sp. TB 23 TaxID=494419 RepID=UPI001ED8F311|nr:hypothetical protein [Arthrobacter sp. TB 23]